ncbi:Predicted acetyltransferase [Amycolatopsis arida]|uniref:Predicted acetyltransferase n=1 Tax=Amycolatopsis arida TaxID=587909 RepID=A0A1I5Q925_9PSEU|nr:GNAT family N-acetyltransferase [Amycolatopsis arida]TDX98756.1 putative acetyltransferase [Amycolatopsis arida]SFP42702.1 Predicted acetyltransferase [Amycolatopsis arida]
MDDFDGRTDVARGSGNGLVDSLTTAGAGRPEQYFLRSLSAPEDVELVNGVLADAFGIEGLVDGRPEHTVFEPARDHVAEYDGEPVANLGAFTRDLSVPGAVLPTTHVAMGAVRQLHRRRGLMTRLMHGQLRESRYVHHEPLSVLWASEARIYQRYGYGMASQNSTFTIDNREVRLKKEPTLSAGRLRETTPERVHDEIREVFERARPSRPGWSSRTGPWWTPLVEDPPPPFRKGYSTMRALLFDGTAGAEGYAIWRRKQDWSSDIVNGEVQVVELVATTPAAYAALWHFLLSVDLTRTVKWDFAAVDEPLRLLVNEPRALRMTTGDGLWARLVDLPAALSARRYSAPLDLVIEVTDSILPENAGRWRLTADDNDTTCVRTAGEPDLVCDVADLGAAYLGGTSLASLAAAGQVRERRPGALAAASTAFGWPVAPSALGLF